MFHKKQILVKVSEFLLSLSLMLAFSLSCTFIFGEPKLPKKLLK